jgi:thioredoxin-dependent peroxiredoxin
MTAFCAGGAAAQCRLPHPSVRGFAPGGWRFGSLHESRFGAFSGASRAVDPKQTNRRPAAKPIRIMAKALELQLKVGELAPAFSAPTQTGETVSLADLRGKLVALYFYPKDDTPGCTTEACSFRDGWSALKKAGVVVLGVSTDPVKAHAKFAEKFNLPFPLLADEERKIVTAYGVWGEKVFMGRHYQGTHRVTFLIGGDGRIAAIWPQVKPEAHAEEVLSAAKALARKSEGSAAT